MSRTTENKERLAELLDMFQSWKEQVESVCYFRCKKSGDIFKRVETHAFSWDPGSRRGFISGVVVDLEALGSQGVRGITCDHYYVQPLTAMEVLAWATTTT